MPNASSGGKRKLDGRVHKQGNRNLYLRFPPQDLTRLTISCRAVTTAYGRTKPATWVPRGLRASTERAGFAALTRHRNLLCPVATK
jgi:hypothetical protein